MFEVKKPFLLLERPYCEQNEIASKQFIKNSKQFHQFHCNLHLSCKIYEGIYVVVEKLKLVKPFIMLKNVGQNIILLTINQSQPNILLITKNTPFCGVFYLMLRKIVEHVLHCQIKTIPQQTGGL